MQNKFFALILFSFLLSFFGIFASNISTNYSNLSINLNESIFNLNQTINSSNSTNINENLTINNTNLKNISSVNISLNENSNFSQNITLNETNISITAKMINTTTSFIIEDINPYKNNSVKEIKIKNKNIMLEDNINSKFEKKLNTFDENEYTIIQFNQKPTKSQSKELNKEGIEILNYVGNNTYYVKFTTRFMNIFKINKNNDLKLKSTNFDDKYLIKSINEVKNEYKAKSKMLDKEFNFWTKGNKENIYLIVKFYRDVDLEIANELMKENNIEVLNEITLINALTVNLTEKQFETLLDLNEVLEVQELPFYFGNQLAESREIINANYVQNIYGLNGTGIIIMEYEGGIPYEHSDLAGRVNNQEVWPYYIYNNHSTFVAGILAGDGSLNSSYKGIAPNSNLVCYETDYDSATNVYNNTNNIEDDYLDAIRDEDANLATNSWGQNIKNFLPGYNTSSVTLSIDACEMYGDYEAVAELFDSIIYEGIDGILGDASPIPIVLSIGNERDGEENPCENETTDTNSSYPYRTIDPIKSSKNTITVGSIDHYLYNQSSSFSSYGPTDDGRIKPELVAPGCIITSTVGTNEYTSFLDGNFACGTSFAAPHVSGTIALMLEQWNKQYSEAPLPSTIKALLLDSTTDLKNDGSGEQVIDGPDYINGFGLLNAKEAVDRIINETFIEANISDENNIYSLNVNNQNELKVTLAWDDLPGSFLINDLDLKLISPTGKIYFPWTLNPENPNETAIRTEEDHLNNVEQVYINQSEIEQGEWLIQISLSNLDTSVDYQKYSLVSENKINPSRVKLISTPSFLQNYTYINNGLYEVILNTNQSLDISLGDYSYFINESEAERKVFVIKQDGNNLPLRYTSEVEQ